MKNKVINTHPTISVVRSRHDVMSPDVTATKTFSFGKVSARNLVLAAKSTLESTGYEGYGAPYYTYVVNIGDVNVSVMDDSDFSDLVKAIEEPSELTFNSSGPKTLTALAQQVIEEVARAKVV